MLMVKLSLKKEKKVPAVLMVQFDQSSSCVNGPIWLKFWFELC